MYIVTGSHSNSQLVEVLSEGELLFRHTIAALLALGGETVFGSCVGSVLLIKLGDLHLLESETKKTLQ